MEFPQYKVTIMYIAPVVTNNFFKVSHLRCAAHNYKDRGSESNTTHGVLFYL
jgi:hypothetical protein